MTDPDMTPEAVERLNIVHRQVCFENGEHPDEVDTPYSLGADALDRVRALSADLEAEKATHRQTVQLGDKFASDAAKWKARAEKAEAERDELKAQNRYWSGEYDAVLAGRADEHDRAEARDAKLKEAARLVRILQKAAHNDRYIGQDYPVQEVDAFLVSIEGDKP